MRVLCVLFVLCFVLCDLGTSAAALDREAFTFTKYGLNVRIEPEQQRLAVRGGITLRNDSSTPQKDLSLQISSSLAWRSIQLGGKPVQFVSQPYTSDIDHTGTLSEAIVILPQAVPPNGEVMLEIGYEGVIPLDTSRLTQIGVPQEKARHTDWDQISQSFTAVRGVGYVTWYPVAIEAARLSAGNSLFDALGRWKQREKEADFKVALRYETSTNQAMSLLWCNGKGTRRVEQDGSARSLVAECTFSPLASGVPAFVLGQQYELDSKAIDMFYQSEHESAAADYAHAAENATPFITAWFGVPREKAELVELSDPAAAPYENGSALLSPLNAISSQEAGVAAAHQLTHAAFPSARPWIYEGLAHFAQAVYLERQSGRQAAMNFMNAHLATIFDTEKTLAADHSAKTSTEQSLVNTNIEELYRSKAMYVWWMLRDMIGEPALKKALAAYRPEQDKESSYLQHLVEAQSKSDLTWFFDDWVYHDHGLPDLRVASVFPTQTQQGTYLVTVTIEDLGSAGAEVPVTVRSPDGEVTKRLEVRAKSTNSFRVVITSMPREVVVNDGSVPETDLSNNIFEVQPASDAH